MSYNGKLGVGYEDDVMPVSIEPFCTDDNKGYFLLGRRMRTEIISQTYDRSGEAYLFLIGRTLYV